MEFRSMMKCFTCGMLRGLYEEEGMPKDITYGSTTNGNPVESILATNGLANTVDQVTQEQPSGQLFIEHKIAESDTLASIAVQYSLRIGDLRRGNRLYSNDISHLTSLSIPWIKDLKIARPTKGEANECEFCLSRGKGKGKVGPVISPRVELPDMKLDDNNYTPPPLMTGGGGGLDMRDKELYADKWVRCTNNEIVVSNFYVTGECRHIPFTDIVYYGIEESKLAALQSIMVAAFAALSLSSFRESTRPCAVILDKFNKKCVFPIENRELFEPVIDSRALVFPKLTPRKR